MLTDLSIRGFIMELASSSPAPGGGSVSALAGANGAALLNMVLNLTLGREKFADVEAELAPLKDKTEALYERLVNLIDIDTEVFNEVMAAFKLPKDTEEQKKERSVKIQEAYKKAADVPLEVAERCLEVLRLCPIIAEKGNPNALSDAGVAAQMAYAGLEGAVMNVKINLSSIKDEEYVAAAREKVAAFLKEGAEIKDRVANYVNEKL
ncbi:cyclodeaminase/cyclohydrolase family protein [Carboxydothermus hydrogenoformans]|uniref:Methenyltetrahydrofolate cyclohydrolase n=1 Tax=Carboxydothermus hydrogenoformans (strain ATCC BAA-161 / DSM 6008 / Z-2901) TaxID=246194 RepID=Q3AE84_CARHZ|nr:cyclodeaminase/cyclohydrolase family protein [Carboxydothermus hydrogenoformans]ABB15420.1 methenyltetrahydrofolate cyclohydrolase [Carboxydothermus hydrogenoformans Z-2901]